MAGKGHSRAVKLAATFLAKLTSVDAAAATFRVDRRTVTSWQAGAVDLPADDWAAIEAVLLARGGEQAARGETRGLVQTLTGAGIAARNTRYATLIARREARKAGEQATEPDERDEIAEAVDALPDERQRWLGDALRHEVERRGIERDRGSMIEVGSPAEDFGGPEPDVLDWIRGVGGWTDEEFADERAALDAAMERLRAIADDPDHVTARMQDPTREVAAGAPVPAVPAEASQEPPVRLAERRPRPEPSVVILPAGEHLEPHDTWQPLNREEF